MQMPTDGNGPKPQEGPYGDGGMHGGHGTEMLVGRVDHARNGFDPMQMLVDWDYGKVSITEGGRTLREYEISAGENEIEIAPGIFFPAWSYNGRVPGPSIRCAEGDLLRVKFSNFGTHPHTIHFHGFHTAEMDGVPGVGRGEIMPGESFTYEFDADPFGCHLYHCHATPLKRHIHKGMYGSFVIDPKAGRQPAREMMMIMNAFDTNFDGGNEVYAVNTVGHEFMQRPIPVKVGELIRIYLVNIVEFDLINSFHLHANFFDYYDTGTSLQPTLHLVDTIMQAQGQRGILEFKFRWPGKYMFHAHISEFAELGWMGFFNAVAPENYDAALAEAGVDAEWDRKGTNSITTQWAEKTV
ncbi:MAG: multicopper oxidase domain-containing protein [Anaerolineae bacterium]|nr:multicopper oxidase domain-containing protein [Anaerolineae bacterium]